MWVYWVVVSKPIKEGCVKKHTPASHPLWNCFTVDEADLVLPKIAIFLAVLLDYSLLVGVTLMALQCYLELALNN